MVQTPLVVVVETMFGGQVNAGLCITPVLLLLTEAIIGGTLKVKGLVATTIRFSVFLVGCTIQMGQVTLLALVVPLILKE
tara:strand:- start:741 stop:980 length:240 start_codon:yes stop_codon:yes gene_type:complete